MPSEAWRYILSVDGRDIELADGEVTLGRSRTSTVRVEHESVSRSHALLTFERGQAVVKDLNSSNGTYVAGRRVLNETRLSDGDRIQLGAAVIAFRVLPPASGVESTAKLEESTEEPPVGIPDVAGALVPPDAPPEQLELAADELFQQVDQHVESIPPPMGDPGAALEAVKSPPVSPPPAREPSRPLPRPGTPARRVAAADGEPSLSQFQIRGGTIAEGARPGSRESLVAETPKNLASFGPRLLATLVDWVILAAIDMLLMSPVFLILFFRGELQSKEAGPDWALVGVGALCGVLILAADLWYVVGGWAKTGRTPGKALLGLKVVTAAAPGKPGLGLPIAISRALFMVLSALPLSAGFLVVLFRKDRRAWHDLLAGTWVVKTR